MRKVVLILLLSFSSSPHAELTDNNLKKLLMVSSRAGQCLTLSEMSSFQAIAKVAGGEEFVRRFFIAEASKDGITTAKLSEICVYAIDIHRQSIDGFSK